MNKTQDGKRYDLEDRLGVRTLTLIDLRIANATCHGQVAAENRAESGIVGYFHNTKSNKVCLPFAACGLFFRRGEVATHEN